MIKTHSMDDIKKDAKDFINSIAEPLQLKTIFETTDDKKILSSDSLLYQDILKFGIEHDYDVGFRFTDLANWLIQYNYEFHNYYTGFKSHVPKSARIANRRERIQRHIDSLEVSDLIVQKAITKAEKNYENIPLYSLTIEGRLLALLIECKKISTNGKRSIGDCRTFQKVLEIINSYTKTKESFSLVFIINFFKNCIEIGVFGNIIRFFIDMVLMNSTIDKGRSLLGLFLGLDHLLYWLAAQPQMFLKTLQDLDQDTKKIYFFS